MRNGKIFDCFTLHTCNIFWVSFMQIIHQYLQLEQDLHYYANVGEFYDIL